MKNQGLQDYWQGYRECKMEMMMWGIDTCRMSHDEHIRDGKSESYIKGWDAYIAKMEGMR